MRDLQWAVTGLVGALLLASVSLAWSAAQYTFTDLGAVVARSLDPGEARIVGRAVDGAQAAILFPAFLLLDLLPEGSFSLANDTQGNATCGYAGTGPNSLRTHAFLRTEGGGVVDLGTTGDGNLFSAASGCNATGQTMGYGDDPTGTLIVPLLFQHGTVTILPTLGNRAVALAINAGGDGVGDGTTPTGQTHALFWPATGGVLDLHTDPGPFSVALDINSTQTIVGWLRTVDSLIRAFVTTPGGTMQLLAPLPGDTTSQAHALNDAGEVVGRSTLPAVDFPSEVSRAVLWENGQPIALLPRTLDAQGWLFEDAVDIGNGGAILVQGRLQGQRRSALLTPVVPTPTPTAPDEEKPKDRKDRAPKKPERRPEHRR